MQQPEKILRPQPRQLGFYDRLYRSLHARLCEYGSTISHSMPIVEDSIQEVFEYFMTHPTKFDRIDNIEAYLFTSLRNNIYKKLNSHDVHLNNEDVLHNLHSENHEYNIIQQETEIIKIKRIRQAISQLPTGESNAIKARFFDSKSYKQIADENQSTTRTVYNQVHSGIKKLRHFLNLL